ncbi:GerAB/ArcD/ProY family transporter [Peribacillus frigoritolerans]|uniref:GerAB/ArcD/ProY family transporter n=1 Tax=Peribacillus frigoritolerans TaxID=450367 RepID=UPI003F81B5A4
MENPKISARQFEILVILFSIGTSVLIIPAPLAKEVKQDAWIVAVIGTGLGLLLVALYIAIGKMFPTMTLVEINEKILGKWLGKTISITFVFFAFLSASGVLFHMGNFLTTQMMPETPIEIFYILFVMILIMGTRLGLETIARAGEILFPFIVFLFVILVVSLLPQVKFENIQPVLETGVRPMIRALFFYASIVSLPTIVLLMVFPGYVNQPKQAQKTFFLGTLITGIFLIIIIALAILELGVDKATMQMYPSYALARLINAGDFFQRVEAIIAIMWFITVYFKITFYFYASVIGLAQILNLKDYRSLTLPLGLILIVLPLITRTNIVQSNTWDKEIWPLYVLTYGLVLPLLLLAVNAFRKTIHQK